MNSKLLSILAIVSYVAAQSSCASHTVSGTVPSPTVAVPPCVQGCIVQGGQDRSCDPNQAACLCDRAFPDITTCVANICSSSDQDTANVLSEQMCNKPFPTPTPGATPGVPTTPPCIAGCIAQAGKDNNCDPSQNACLCETSFQDSTSCVFNTCSGADQVTAEVLSEILCNRPFLPAVAGRNCNATSSGN